MPTISELPFRPVPASGDQIHVANGSSDSRAFLSDLPRAFPKGSVIAPLSPSATTLQQITTINNMLDSLRLSKVIA